MKFPDGTLFVGEKAFVPNPDGNGYKKFYIDDRFEIEVLSDNLAAADVIEDDDSDAGNAVTDIKFDIDYGFANKTAVKIDDEKPNTVNDENSENSKVVSADFADKDTSADETDGAEEEEETDDKISTAVTARVCTNAMKISVWRVLPSTRFWNFFCILRINGRTQTPLRTVL